MKQEKSLIKVALLSGFLFFLASCGKAGYHTENSRTAEEEESSFSNTNSSSQEYSETEELDPKVLASFSNFTYKSTYLNLKGEGNQLYSPVGPYIMLSLLSESAGGNTKTELIEQLNLTSLTDREVQKNSEALIKVFKGKKSSDMTNSMWLTQGDSYQSNFEKVAKNSYQVETFEVDFAKQLKKTQSQMAKWSEKQLGKNLFNKDDVKEETRLALINTFKIDFSWSTPFDEKETVKKMFSTPTKTVKADFMNLTLSSTFTKGENYISSSLDTSYGGRVLFVLPDEGVDPRSFVKAPEEMKKIVANESQEAADVHYSIPKFSFQNRLDLRPAAMNMGINDLFDSTRCDLSKMLQSGNDVYLGVFTQNNAIEVNEKGVKAESVTVGGIETKSAMPSSQKISFEVNRPFLFLIFSKDNVLTFIGVVDNPTLK